MQSPPRPAQSPNGADGQPFVKYTLPALEVRLMLLAIKARNESFTLEYTRVAGPPPAQHAAAEAWRARGCGTRVVVSTEPSGAWTCAATDTCSPRSASGGACASDELAMLTMAPGWLARTLVLSNPYPILEPPGRYCGSSG